MEEYITDPNNREIIHQLITYADKDGTQYKMILYQCLGLLRMKKITLKELARRLMEGKILTRCEAYEKIWKQQREQDEYIQNPMEMVDGVIQCGRCKGWQIMVVQKQTRSADEGYTMFYTCVSQNCGHKWIGS